MKNSTLIIAAVFSLLTGVAQIPDVQRIIVSYVSVHPALSASVADVASILALIHEPNRER